MIDLPGEPISEERRRPLIDANGRKLLNSLLEHQFAPRYNHTCGDRLTARGLEVLRALDISTRTAKPLTFGQKPDWLPWFVEHCRTQVPIYRKKFTAQTPFESIALTSRNELAVEHWSFVPDDHPLDDMVVFTTTGTTTGNVAYIASTPETTAAYSIMLNAALRLHGRELVGGAGTCAVAQVCWQKSTYTYVSNSTFLSQAAILKLNLNPDEWKDPSHIEKFLSDLAPEIYTGDPVAFSHLVDLDLRPSRSPQGLLSTAMALSDGLRSKLESRFDCPVIDVYGMNEAGPIAASLPRTTRTDGSACAASAQPSTEYAFLQPRLYVEVLRPDGTHCDLGERGEIVLTGGFNPALPLLRYRTGDSAALAMRGKMLVLRDFHGRPMVPFETADGRAVNTIDLTIAMRALLLSRFRIHQNRDGSVDVGVQWSGPAEENSLLSTLRNLFGDLEISIRRLDGEPEQVSFSSDLVR